MVNFLAAIVIVAILFFAGRHIYKEKKRGVRCVGCPDGGTCGGNCGSCSGCHH